MHRFTPREMEVARLIDQGYTYDEMGEKLGISPRTCRLYADRLRAALGVSKKRQIPQAMRLLGLL